MFKRSLIPGKLYKLESHFLFFDGQSDIIAGRTEIGQVCMLVKKQLEKTPQPNENFFNYFVLILLNGKVYNIHYDALTERVR